MSSRIIAWCSAVVAGVAVVAWLRWSNDAQQVSESAAPTAAVAAPRTVFPAPSTQTAPEAASASGVQLSTASRAAVPLASEQPEENGLQLDEHGNLVKNPQTRDELERILNGDPDAIETRRQEILATLPPAAAREALDLLERFTNYRAALRQAVPDTALALTEQDALVMLDTMHALRVTYFGAQLTEVFFGAEEAIGRGTAEGMLRAGPGAR